MLKGSEQANPLFWSALWSLLLVAVFITPLRSADLWWHLDSGRWMLQHGQFLDHEVRSFSLAGTYWSNFSWLFQVVIAALEAVSGLWALLLLKALLVWLMLFLLLRSIPPQVIPLAFLLAVLLLSWRIFPYLYLRPHLFEGVFLAAAILFFHRAPDRHDPLWYALLILLWANSHASAVVGAAALALHYVVGAEYRIPSLKTLRQRLPVGLLLWSLVFATPNGVGILDVLFRHAGGDYLHMYIREWLAPDFLHPLMFIALLASITVALFQRGVLVPAEIVLILVFVVFGDHSRRFQFELALLLIRPTTILIGMWISWFVHRVSLTRAYWSWLYALVLIGLLAIVYPPPVYWSKLDGADFPLQQNRFPHVAMSVLQPVLENEAELRVLNDYGWGGYLGWYGAGKLKIYIDGRTPTVFSEGLMLSQILARQKPDFLRDLSRRWQVQAIVLRRTVRLPIPVTDPEWKLVAFDSISMLYLRVDLAREYRIGGLGFDPFSAWPRVDARHVEQAITQLRDLLAFDANNDLAWLRLGQLLGSFEPRAAIAQRAEAMQAVQHAIELNAENVPAYLTLANLRLKAGDSNARVAQPLLTLLEQVNAQGLAGHEVEIATLLLRTGYFNQVIEVLSPENWPLHQQLDQAFDVWLLRMQAHARLGDRDAFELDRRMAEGLAQDGGAAAWKRLESAMRAVENFWRKAEN